MNKTYCSALDQVNEEVYKVLDDLGLQQHLLGYNYVAYGVQYLLDKLASNVSLTKDVYTNIAKIFGTTGSRVERAIRHSVEVLFDKVDPEVLYKYFGNSVDAYKGKTTNSQFLYTIAHRVHRNLRN